MRSKYLKEVYIDDLSIGESFVWQHTVYTYIGRHTYMTDEYIICKSGKQPYIFDYNKISNIKLKMYVD